MLYKKKYRESKRLSDETTSSYLRQKITMIREELLIFHESQLLESPKIVSSDWASGKKRIPDDNDHLDIVECVDNKGAMVECIDLNQEFVSPLKSINIDDDTNNLMTNVTNSEEVDDDDEILFQPKVMNSNNDSNGLYEGVQQYVYLA